MTYRTIYADKQDEVEERAMGAELGHHLGYPAGQAKLAANQRNGKSAKTALTGEGPVRIEVPRDRDGSFEPTHPYFKTSTTHA